MTRIIVFINLIFSIFKLIQLLVMYILLSLFKLFIPKKRFFKLNTAFSFYTTLTMYKNLDNSFLLKYLLWFYNKSVKSGVSLPNYLISSNTIRKTQNKNGDINFTLLYKFNPRMYEFNIIYLYFIVYTTLMISEDYKSFEPNYIMISKVTAISEYMKESIIISLNYNFLIHPESTIVEYLLGTMKARENVKKLPYPIHEIIFMQISCWKIEDEKSLGNSNL